MSLTVRPADYEDEAELIGIADVVNATDPDWPTSVDEMRWTDSTYPGTIRLIAELDGRPVGVATAGRIDVYPPEYDGLWGSVDVLAEARGRGVGSALLRGLAHEAYAAGKGHLHMTASEGRPESIDFLKHRGFVEIERQRMARLELAAVERPSAQPPPDLELTDLARRPDLVAGVHRVAVETFPGIPGSDPLAAGDLTEFRARDVDRPGMPADAFVVAVDRVSGEVAGYASLVFVAGSTTRAIHDMTAVRAAWRGRGLATAMKRATIAWAIDHGLTALETGTDEANGAMQAVNARLGYEPRPDEVTLRGSVRAAMMAR
jgi:mycothiol synthase